MRRAALVILALGLLWPLHGRAQLPEELVGQWAGPIVEATGEATERVVRLAVRARADGFDLDMAVPDMPPVRAQMVATDLPRVYQVAAAPRGLFSFFEGAGRSDPFEGVPLIWARTTATSLVAYRLQIGGDGGTVLVRAAIEPTEEGLRLSVERRVDVHPPERWQAQLEREG